MRHSVLLLAAVAVAGCSGGDSIKITGTVRLNGNPLADASVRFWPKDDLNLGACGGSTGSDGRFEIVADARSRMMVKPGRYDVVVTKYVTRSPNMPKGEEGGQVPVMPGMPGVQTNLVPTIYGDQQRSPLTVEIKARDNDFPLELSGKP